MLSLITIINAIIIPLIVGFLLLKSLLPRYKIDILLAFALSYGLGLGILTHVMLFLGFLSIPLTYHTITTSIFILSIPLAFFLRVKLNNRTNENLKLSLLNNDSEQRSNFTDKLISLFFVSYVLIYILFAFYLSLRVPIIGWDTFATAGFNAKIIFFENTLEHIKFFPHASFPLHIPFCISWMSFNFGQWNDQVCKIFFPLFFISFGSIFFFFIRQYANKFWAMMGTALLFSSNLLVENTITTYRDLPLLYYNCSAIIFLLLWKDKKDDAFLILAAIFSGFATFVKLEGSVYLGIHMYILLIILLKEKLPSLKASIIKFLKFAVPSISIYCIYHFFKLVNGVPINEKAALNLSQISFSHIIHIVKRFGFELFLSANWSIVWALLIFSIFLHWRKLINNFNIKLLLSVLILFLAVPFAAALLLTSAKDILEAWTLPRIFLHFFPLAPILIIFLNYNGENYS